MSRTPVAVTPLRQLVDEARGDTTLGLVALTMGWSSQRLTQKLNGDRTLSVPDAVAIGSALDVDPVRILAVVYPELEQADPLAEIRHTLASADRGAVEAVEVYAAQLVAGEPTKRAGAGRRSPTAGSRGAPSGDEHSPPRSRSTERRWKT